MKIADGGIEVYIVAEPKVIETKRGTPMMSLYSISNVRKKNEGGGWDDDPRYAPLRVQIVAFGDVVDQLIADDIRKGSIIVITDGRIGKPNHEYADLEIRMFGYRAKMGASGRVKEKIQEPTAQSDLDLPF